MAIGTDFEIQGDGDIRYVSGSTNYTVLELHQWLGGLADDASSVSDDFMDISTDTPSLKQFDTIITLNYPYNIDDTASQYFYGGSVIQANGDEIYDGLQVLAPAGMYLQIIQNGALATNFWTTGINADSSNGISHQFILKVRTAGADIDGRRLIGTTREWGKTFLEYKVNGTARGVNVMAFTGWGDDLNNTTAVGTVSGWTTITNTEGYANLDVDNDSTDEYYYSEWNRDSYSINQFYERMKWLVRRDSSSTIYGLDGDLFRGITHDITVDTGGGSFNWTEPEAVSWSGGTGQMFAVDNVDDDSTTKMYIQLLTGVAPTDGQTITGGSSGATNAVDTTVTERSVSTPFCGISTGTALIGAYGFCLEVLDLSETDQIRALDDTVYTPPNYVTFTVGGLESTEDYVLVANRGYKFAYDTEASGPFTIGETLTFTTPAGTAILDKIIDLGTVGIMFIGPILTGSVPEDDSGITGGSSSATASVNGSVSSNINFRQLTLNGALTTGAVTSVVVSETIPADTPATGTIRIQRNSGKYSKHAYSAWSTSTFTITSHDFSGDNASDDNNVYISYIDMLSDSATEDFTAVYDAGRTVYVRVRDGGATPIVTFETTVALGSADASVTAIRTSDA